MVMIAVVKMMLVVILVLMSGDIIVLVVLVVAVLVVMVRMMVVGVLVVAMAVAAAFARADASYFKYAKLKKYPDKQPAGSRPEAGREPLGSRTAVETSLTRTKVGRKKPYANRIQEFAVEGRPRKAEESQLHQFKRSLW